MSKTIVWSVNNELQFIFWALSYTSFKKNKISSFFDRKIIIYDSNSISKEKFKSLIEDNVEFIDINNFTKSKKVINNPSSWIFIINYKVSSDFTMMIDNDLLFMESWNYERLLDDLNFLENNDFLIMGRAQLFKKNFSSYKWMIENNKNKKDFDLKSNINGGLYLIKNEEYKKLFNLSVTEQNIEDFFSETKTLRWDFSDEAFIFKKYNGLITNKMHINNNLSINKDLSFIYKRLRKGSIIHFSNSKLKEDIFELLKGNNFKRDDIENVLWIFFKAKKGRRVKKISKIISEEIWNTWIEIRTTKNI